MFDFIIFIAIAIPVLYIIVLINAFVINLCMSHAPKYKNLYKGQFASVVFKSAGIYTGIGILLLIGFIFLEGLPSGLFLILIVPPALIPPITLLIIPISIFLLQQKQRK